MQRKLIIHWPSRQGEERCIEPGAVFSIGSGSHNSVVIRESGVSDRHCSIVVVEERSILISLSTSGQTFLNGSLVERQALRDGDSIIVGAVAMEYHETVRSPARTPIAATAREPSAFADAPPPPAAARPSVSVRRRVAPLLVAGAALLVVIAAATYLLSNTEDARRQRQRRALTAALDQAQYKRAAKLAKQYSLEFPTATDNSWIEEAGDFAGTMDTLQVPRPDALGAVQRRIQSFLDDHPAGENRAKLLKRACEVWLDVAEGLASAQNAAAADLDRAETLANQVTSWKLLDPGGMANEKRLGLLDARIQGRRDEIRYGRAVDDLLAKAESAMRSEVFSDFFDELSTFQALYSARPFGQQLQARVDQVREAERRSISLQETNQPATHPTPQLDGRLVHRSVSVRYPIRGQPGVTRNPVCLVNGSTCYALDGGTGALKWCRAVRHSAFWRPLVLEEAGLAVTADGEDGLAAWDLADGAARWQLTCGAAILGPPVVANGYLFILTEIGDLLRLSLQGHPAGVIRTRGRFAAPGAASATRWAGISTDGTLYLVNMENGQCEWIERGVSVAPVLLSPTLMGDVAIVMECDASHRTRLHPVRFGDGIVQRQPAITLDGWVPRLPIATSGVMAVTTDKGNTTLLGCNSTNLDEGVFRMQVDGLTSRASGFAPVLTGFEVTFRTIRFQQLTDRLEQYTVDLLAGTSDHQSVPEASPAGGMGEACIAAWPLGGDTCVLSVPPRGEYLIVTCLSLNSPRAVRWQTVLGDRWYSLIPADQEVATFVTERGGVRLSPLLEPADPLAVVIDGDVPMPWNPNNLFAWDVEKRLALAVSTALGEARPTLYAYDLDGTWRERWKATLPEPTAVSPLLQGDSVVVLFASGRLALYASENGNKESTSEIPIMPRVVEGSLVTGPVALSDRRYLIAREKELYVVSVTFDDEKASIGTITTTLDFSEEASDLDSDAHYAYLADSAGTIHVLDGVTLESVGEITMGHGTHFAKLGEKSGVLAYSPAGMLTWLDGTSGRWSWNPPAACPVLGKPVLWRELVTVTLEDGSVHVLSRSDGQLLEAYQWPIDWSTPVRPTPAHLFGVSRYGEVYSWLREPRAAVTMPADHEVH